jgi:hypothetical protein
MATTLKVRTGDIEIELQSDDLAGDLEIALSAIERLAPTGGPSERPTRKDGARANGAHHGGAGGDFQQGINSYAAKFEANSSRKLLRIAAIHLTLNDGKDSFTRDELFARARTAREWKKEYVDQQALNIGRMVKAHELIERSNGEFSVPGRALEDAKRVFSGV